MCLDFVGLLQLVIMTAFLKENMCFFTDKFHKQDATILLASWDLNTHVCYALQKWQQLVLVVPQGVAMGIKSHGRNHLDLHLNRVIFGLNIK